MKVGGVPYRSIWRDGAGGVVVIDQTRLPHAFATRTLRDEEDCAAAIRTMTVRGAPLIGAVGAYGLAMALADDPGDAALERAYAALLATRPTAVNLRWALDQVRAAAKALAPARRAAAALACADALCEADVATNAAIGDHGLGLVRQAWDAKARRGPVNILTHCNTGWIACVDWGTALGIVYKAHDSGVPVHVWVDETRPRNQGGALTTWELANHGVPFTLIADNAGAHFMQRGQVDLCLVGADRVTAQGDVCNKIGTYMKALAAREAAIPFHVALPRSTIDWTIESGAAIEIEERSPEEVTHITGADEDGRLVRVRLTPPGTPAANPAFDVTPAELVTSFITEHGVFAPSALGRLRPVSAATPPATPAGAPGSCRA
jgi:methylthioribose-1-phosphate isomerase